MLLGNLSLKEIQNRTGVEFPQVLVDYMETRHQSCASNIKKGKWHCFDIPFILVAGDLETATEIYNNLKSLSGDFKEEMQIAIQT